jgi:hypothetical protein
MRKLTFVLCQILLCINSSSAQYEYRPVTLIGDPARISCGYWTENRQTVQYKSLEVWIWGYLSGATLSGKDDPVAGTDAAGIRQWIDNYCKGHPTEILVNAVNSFVSARRHDVP